MPLPRQLAAATIACGSLALALGAGATATQASAGSLVWTQVNVFDGDAPANTDRTWLGYATRPGAPMGAEGTAAPKAPATGPVVDKNSRRGANRSYTWRLPMQSGSIDEQTGNGRLTFAGGVLFTSPQPPMGHGFNISIEDPVIELNGLAGKLTASGQYVEGTGKRIPRTYAAQPVYALDLSRSSVVVGADGRRQITDIAPKLMVTGVPFPSLYGGGVSGPDRTPNTFGKFAIRLATAPATSATCSAGTGSRRAKTIRSYVVKLRSAPFKGGRSRAVRVYCGKRLVATGKATRRTLQLRLRPNVKSLSAGRHGIVPSGGKRMTNVRIAG